MEPFVKARPAEEMAAQGDNGVLGQVEADIAFKITSITVVIVAAGERRPLGWPAR